MRLTSEVRNFQCILFYAISQIKTNTVWHIAIRSIHILNIQPFGTERHKLLYILWRVIGGCLKSHSILIWVVVDCMPQSSEVC